MSLYLKIFAILFVLISNARSEEIKIKWQYSFYPQIFECSKDKKICTGDVEIQKSEKPPTNEKVFCESYQGKCPEASECYKTFLNYKTTTITGDNSPSEKGSVPASKTLGFVVINYGYEPDQKAIPALFSNKTANPVYLKIPEKKLTTKSIQYKNQQGQLEELDLGKDTEIALISKVLLHCARKFEGEENPNFCKEDENKNLLKTILNSCFPDKGLTTISERSETRQLKECSLQFTITPRSILPEDQFEFYDNDLELNDKSKLIVCPENSSDSLFKTPVVKLMIPGCSNQIVWGDINPSVGIRSASDSAMCLLSEKEDIYCVDPIKCKNDEYGPKINFTKPADPDSNKPSPPPPPSSRSPTSGSNQ